MAEALEDIWIDLHKVNYMAMRLPMLVVYDRPKDYPEHVVIVVWDLNSRTNLVSLCKTVEDAENSIPNWFVKIGPEPGDDPKIKGVYV